MIEGAILFFIELFALALLVPLVNVLSWLAIRGDPYDEYPWSWRVLIGPWSYYPWLKKKGLY